MSDFLLLLSSTAPVFLIIILGIVLRFLGQIDDNFVKISSKLVFNYSLPAFIFLKLTLKDVSQEFNTSFVLFAVISTIIYFGLCWVVGKALSNDGKKVSAIIQGAFRSNFAIIGFALITNVYGPEAITKPALLLVFALPLFNVLSIVALTFPLQHKGNDRIKNSIIEILKNPLFLAVVFSVPFSLLKVHIPEVVVKSGDYLARIALPLALIGIGGSLNFSYLKDSLKESIIASLIKIVFIPAIFTPLAVWYGFRGIELLTLFILFGTPTAIASFIMAGAMGSDLKLTGNIVVLSTVGSVITITVGLFILRYFSYI